MIRLARSCGVEYFLGSDRRQRARGNRDSRLDNDVDEWRERASDAKLVGSVHAAWRNDAKSHRCLTDVPVQFGGWESYRLAPGAPRLARAGRRRAGVRGDDLRFTRRPHHARSHAHHSPRARRPGAAARDLSRSVLPRPAQRRLRGAARGDPRRSTLRSRRHPRPH